MTTAEFKHIIDNNISITEDEIPELINVLYLDAEGPCELLEYINRVYFLAVNTTGLYVQHEIHNCASKYDEALSAAGRNSINDHFPIYQVEMTYCYFSNSLADCLHIVNLILDSGKASPEQRASALTYAVTIFARKNMLKELRTYINKSIHLIKNKRLDSHTRCFLYMDILETYALLGRNEDFYRTFTDALTLFDILNEEGSDDSFMLNFSQALELRRLLNDILNDSERLENDEVVIRFEEIMDSISTHCTDWVEDYSTLLLPILRYVKGLIPDNRMIRYCQLLIDGESAPIDKISFYTFLIDELKITQEQHIDIYTAYFALLRQYLEDSKESTRLAVINENKNHQQELEIKKISVTDELTHLGNLRAYNKAIEDCKSQDSVENMSILAIDVNGLKMTNDTFGHSAGDELLLATAEICRIIFSGIGTCYRLGGDEFSVIVNADKTTFDTTLKRFDEALTEYKCSFGNNISVSYGQASLRDYPEASFEELGKIADSEMYVAKKNYYQTPEANRRRGDRRTGIDRRQSEIIQ